MCFDAVKKYGRQVAFDRSTSFLALGSKTLEMPLGHIRRAREAIPSSCIKEKAEDDGFDSFLLLRGESALGDGGNWGKLREDGGGE